jgi:tRNA threonylcarbamoyl adenosine modification protein (Sua5/YciO/YrdC/YwlC family)
MAVYYRLHPTHPQGRDVDQIISRLADGAVMLYPTDTLYAIGCDLNSKQAIQRVRQIKQLANEKPLTLLCPSLSNITQYAHVTNTAYRIMRRLIPGPYTFLLPTTKLVPKLVMNPKRKTTGIRVPDHAGCQALLANLGNPIISTSAHTLEEGTAQATTPYRSRVELFDSLEKLVDIVIDDGLDQEHGVSTILDLTNEEPKLVRKGLGWEAVENWRIDMNLADRVSV